MLTVNRFWGAIWRVVMLVIAIRLLEYVLGLALMLFGILPLLVSKDVTEWILLLVAIGVPTVGTLTYVDWQWGWKPENMGLARRPAAIGWALAGLALGAVAVGAIHAVAAYLPGGPGGIVEPALKATIGLPALLNAIAVAVGLEVVYRGAALSRYQTDLDERQVLWAGLLTALAAMIFDTLFRVGVTSGGGSMGTAAMAVALTMIFLRTDSVWFTAGLHVAAAGLPHILSVNTDDGARTLVWGVVAAILLALELLRQNRAPRRVRSGGRSGPQRVNRGRTVRGPWGPH